MTSPNKLYSVQAEKQESIGGVGAVSGFPGAALLSMRFTAAKVPGRSRCNISQHPSITLFPSQFVRFIAPHPLTPVFGHFYTKKRGLYRIGISPKLMKICYIDHAINYYPNLSLRCRLRRRRIQSNIIEVHRTRTTCCRIVPVAKTKANRIDIG